MRDHAIVDAPLSAGQVCGPGDHGSGAIHRHERELGDGTAGVLGHDVDEVGQEVFIECQGHLGGCCAKHLTIEGRGGLEIGMRKRYSWSSDRKEQCDHHQDDALHDMRIRRS